MLDALRQPLERGEVTIARAAGSATFPCRAQLVLAANPCPCATAAGDTACTCSPLERRRYRSRLSGPLLDRIDLRVELPPVTRATWLDGAAEPESTEIVAARVLEARAAAGHRLSGTRFGLNSQVPGRLLRERWRVPRGSLALAERALERGALSVRGFDRVLRVASTLSRCEARCGSYETRWTAPPGAAARGRRPGHRANQAVVLQRADEGVRPELPRSECTVVLMVLRRALRA